jgi:hypothetical protein
MVYPAVNGYPVEVNNSGVVAGSRPTLIFFTSSRNGLCRRAEGFLAQVLQRRHNHDTFAMRTVVLEQRPDLLDRFGIDHTPTLAVVVGRTLHGTLVQPRGCEEIRIFLSPWLK